MKKLHQKKDTWGNKIGIQKGLKKDKLSKRGLFKEAFFDDLWK